MIKKSLGVLLFSLAIAVIGAVGGYFARQAQDQAEADAAAQDDAGGGTVHDHGPELDPATLETLGIRSGVAELGRHTVTLRVQAVIEDPGIGQRRLVAPFGGVVTAVPRRPGAKIEKGEVVVALVRDDIPRRDLTYTASLLSPVDEELHGLFVGLRRESRNTELAIAERDRLAKLYGDGTTPLVGQEALFRAEQNVSRVQQAVAGVRFELHYHGFTEAQIDGIAEGQHLTRDQGIRIRSLRHHGLWSESVARAYAALPESAQQRPWTVAALGELESLGLFSAEVGAAIVEEATLRSRFVDASHLLLGGTPIARVVHLARAGALEPIIEVRAPADREDWDLRELAVRAGDRVAAGDVLARLSRPDEMWLRLTPFGDEVGALAAACRDGTPVAARPLTVGTGPELVDLRIDRLEGQDRVSAVVVAANTAFEAPSGARTWGLRAGTRYEIRIPVRTIEGVILSVGALTRRGPDRIAFESHGDHFHEMVVQVLYEDDEVVVLPPDGRVKPGDDIIVGGAFALGQAMQLEGGGGHHHHH